jgi:DNA invertase Pin-like site-specific DNA recombinase
LISRPIGHIAWTICCSDTPGASAKKTANAVQRPGKLIGYARVSTADQDLAVQREVLAGAGVSVVFEEKASGTKRQGRTELEKVLSVLGEGDALVVTRLDRLGRSMRDLANIAYEIEQAGAHLKVVEQSVDTSSTAGRATACWPSSPPSKPTSGASASSKGIAMAKRQGIYKGGKERLDRQRVKEMLDRGLGPAAIARELGMARSSVYRLRDGS